MSRTLVAVARSFAIFALWLLILVTAPVSWVLGGIGSGALSVSEWAKDRLDDLYDRD